MMTAETKQKAAIWLMLVFVLGAAVGGVFGYGFARKSYAATIVTAPALSEPERRGKRLAEMKETLGLSEEQVQKAEGILQEGHNAIKGIRDKSDAECEAVRMHAREEMRAFLTPEQKPKFEEMVRKLDEERKSKAVK